MFYVAVEEHAVTAVDEDVCFVARLANGVCFATHLLVVFFYFDCYLFAYVFFAYVCMCYPIFKLFGLFGVSGDFVDDAMDVVAVAFCIASACDVCY